MKVLIIYAHPNPMSFTKAILENFVRGLKEAGHQYEILDRFKIKFYPKFQDNDFTFFIDEELPQRIRDNMNLRESIVGLAGGPIKRFIARWMKNKTDKDIIKLIKVQRPKDVIRQQ